MSTSDQIFIKPVAGAKVRDPHTAIHLADDGEYKPRTAFWARRITDGDVVQVKPPKAAKTGGDK